MSRRKKGQKVDGWLILDKPLGITSTQAVNVVRRLFDAQKAGHGGTLDPLATGILPIALGEATKTVPYVMDGTKTYRFTLKFGEARSTDDAEGEVIARSEKRPSAAEIEAALPSFIGEISQIPPQFSAIKVAGERAYDLARDGEKVDLAPRIIRVEDFRLTEILSADEAVFEVRSGKGAYMRSLGRDLAQHLGSQGHISALRRLSVGGFTEKQAISLDALKALGHIPAAFEHLLPIETALDDIPALALSATEAIRLRSGQPVGLLHRQDRDRFREFTPGGMVCAMSEGKLLALTRYEAGELVPVRVINH
ncbi:tRNA pseudouridine(55) synthase TruB [Dongia rigui]|uniref:tRNA pseudouridine synthase B n=1 Tax=Dongia rigui TaxID=940149 RepID=A0ABU5DVV5_9PROT|nr:tRNA pseudouridine(55) synthase TruB [Dongia rigui]MDY0871439.1 tRNA pseudouridine(55) synthase TruB [Dongia rigui]